MNIYCTTCNEPLAACCCRRLVSQQDINELEKLRAENAAMRAVIEAARAALKKLHSVVCSEWPDYVAEAGFTLMQMLEEYDEVVKG